MNMTELSNFLYPHSRYRGVVTPENLIFNANLQEFAQRISFISGLETNGKLSPAEAYSQIETLWETFKAAAHVPASR